MSSLRMLNAAAFLFAIGTSTAVAWVPRFRSAEEPKPVELVAASPPARELVDHGGVVVPKRDYRRIVSGSTIADALLLELCEPDRIVAFTAYGTHHALRSYRYAGKPTIEGLKDVESILALHPDLVLVNGIGDPRPIARLRGAGVTVYDLGEMRGLRTLFPDIRELAELLGHPERGEQFVDELREQLSSVADDIPPSQRRRGMYLSNYGGKLFGGAVGTSYDDVLVAGGLEDAARAYHDWPEYSVEQVLVLDPDVLVTNTGMRASLCEHAGMSSLRACKAASGVVEIDDGVLGDPGPGMVDAARAVRAAVYG